MMHIVLAGNPNCGKTTLFNALTGSRQRVGNWPGVTVEKKSGLSTLNGLSVEVTDLPGVYSLVAAGSGSEDERIAAHALETLTPDCIVNVLDACHLERHLYLTSQLLESGVPVVVALNMTDLATQRGISIDTSMLASALGCTVVAIQAHNGVGLAELKDAITAQKTPPAPLALALSPEMEQIRAHLKSLFLEEDSASGREESLVRRLMEGDEALLDRYPALRVHLHEKDADLLLADARFSAIHVIVLKAESRRSDASEHFTARLDRLVLHRVFALPIFLAVMYLMFLFAINIGGAFQDFFDIATDTLFVQGTAALLSTWHAPGWVIALLADGVGKGINTTLTFIPVIGAMFFFLALLEASGYMARAAFVVDRLMRAMGLPGKSFVPMIVGFGCNVPAIMAARTLDSREDRLLTVVMSPFMSCSARLAIYAVFVAAFFPSGGQNVVFSLYLVGIGMAVLTGFLLRKTCLKGEASPLILELPAYHRPAFRRLLRETHWRLRHFVRRAGRMIIPVCVLLGGLNALTLSGDFSAGEANTASVLSWLGQCLTPLFAPLGLHADNWPATVGLLTGMLAKEVVVGSLNALYVQTGQLTALNAAHFDLLAGLREAVLSIPQNLAGLWSALANPILASAPDSEVSKTVYGMMYARFDGQAGAYAYLLFILLYIPCVSTMAAIREEASQRWMRFSVAWSFFVAYAVAVGFYQLATFSAHPLASILWIALFAIATFGIVKWLKRGYLDEGGAHAFANP